MGPILKAMRSAEGSENGIQEQIKKLKELQSVSTELHEMDVNLRKYPEELSVFKGEIQSVKEFLTEKNLQTEEADKEKSLLEKELSEKKLYIEKAEERLLNIKTHREYEALQKELTEAKKQCIEIEEKILVLMEKLETLGAETGDLEQSLKEKTEEYTPKIEEIEKTIGELESKAAPCRERRDSIAGGLSPEVHSVYLKISGKSHTFLAEARGEMCLNCNMNIPPQMFNEVLTGTKIIQCPNCNRILHCENAG